MSGLSCLKLASCEKGEPLVQQKGQKNLYSLFHKVYSLNQLKRVSLRQQSYLNPNRISNIAHPYAEGLKGFLFSNHSFLDSYCFSLQALDLENSWAELITSKEKVDFIYELHLFTLNLLEKRTYTSFDAHTTSNCCHGIATFINIAINKVLQENLENLRSRVSLNYQKFLKDQLSIEQFIQLLPKNLLAIVSAYVLFQAGVLAQDQGRITVPEVLCDLHPGAGKKFAIKLVRKLQKNFSYAISNSYAKMLSQIPEELVISHNKVSDWGRYVCGHHIRMDKRRRFYAPCLFSTQVTLAYLASIKNKIAVVCDLVSKNYEKIGRYIVLLQGDGKKFIRVPEDTFHLLDLSEPVFVVSGFSCLDSQSISDFADKMREWVDDVPTLILANDTYYPQFPKVGDDPDFNSDPINPPEKNIKKTISNFAKIKGVSLEDPSFFCINHYYPASLYEVLKDIPKNSLLPFALSFTPRVSFS